MVRVDSHSARRDDTPPVAALAARQHGMVARRQLAALGLSGAAIDAWLRRGRLFLRHRGVYAVGHEAVGLRGREMAAVLACGDGALLSHQSAAGLWGIRPPWQGTIHVTSTRARRLDGVHVHRARALHPRDRAVRDGISTTPIARTLLDLAEELPARAVERALAEAEVRRLLTRDELEALIERSPGRNGAAVLAAILTRDRNAPTRSELEERFLALVTDHDLPRPRINRRVHGYEVDFHWPEARVVVELDGFAYHGTREAFERDRERDAVLQAHGWRVIRLTYRRLAERPGAVAGGLRRLLAPGDGALRRPPGYRPATARSAHKSTRYSSSSGSWR